MKWIDNIIEGHNRTQGSSKGLTDPLEIINDLSCRFLGKEVPIENIIEEQTKGYVELGTLRDVYQQVEIEIMLNQDSDLIKRALENKGIDYEDN